MERTLDASRYNEFEARVERVEDGFFLDVVYSKGAFIGYRVTDLGLGYTKTIYRCNSDELLNRWLTRHNV